MCREEEAMRCVLYLGSCGESWPPNTTPIQRANFLQKYFLVDFADLAEAPNAEIMKYKRSRYFCIDKYGKEEILKALQTQEARPGYAYVWVAGPSWRATAAGREIADHFSAKLVVDMFDHERLSAGVAWHKKRYARAFLYELTAIYLRYLLRKTDVFIHAIANDIGSYRLPKSVAVATCLNGVCFDLLPEHIASTPMADEFSLCYVGESSVERTPILPKIIELAAQSAMEFNLHLVGSCDSAYLARLKLFGRDKIKIHFHGFLPWVEAMRIVAQCHACLYLFPDREDLSCVYPLKIAEYLHLGKPVLASDLAGARQMLGDGLKECLLPSSPQAWTEKIQELLKPEYRGALASKAQDRAQFLNWDCLHAPLKKLLLEDANAAASNVAGIA